MRAARFDHHDIVVQTGMVAPVVSRSTVIIPPVVVASPLSTTSGITSSSGGVSKWKAAERTDHDKAASRIMKELMEFTKDPPPDCYAGPYNPEDLFLWEATIMGPSGTVYAGGIFDLSIRIPPDYPFQPPKFWFETKVYHCNVSKNGSICMDLLKDNWSPATTIAKVLVSIGVLLQNPNPSDPMEKKIAKQYKKDRAAYDETARQWVLQYATRS